MNLYKYECENLREGCIRRLTIAQKSKMTKDQIVQECPNCDFKDGSTRLWKKYNDTYENTCWLKAAQYHLLLRLSGVLQQIYKYHCETNLRPDSGTRSRINTIIMNTIINWNDLNDSEISRETLAYWYMMSIKHPGLEPLHDAILVRQLEFCVLKFLEEFGAHFGFKILNLPENYIKMRQEYNRIGKKEVTMNFIEHNFTVSTIIKTDMHLSQNEKGDKLGSEHPFLHPDGIVKDTKSLLFSWSYKKDMESNV